MVNIRLIQQQLARIPTLTEEEAQEVAASIRRIMAQVQVAAARAESHSAVRTRLKQTR